MTMIPYGTPVRARQTHCVMTEAMTYSLCGHGPINNIIMFYDYVLFPHPPGRPYIQLRTTGKVIRSKKGGHPIKKSCSYKINFRTVRLVQRLRDEARLHSIQVYTAPQYTGVHTIQVYMRRRDD